MDVYSRTSKRLREAAMFSAALAGLLLIAACLCFRWVYYRGAFEGAPVEHPVSLKAGSSFDLHFSVPFVGERDVEIWYSRSASGDVHADLEGIRGQATLRVGENLIAQFALPVDHYTCDRDGCAMILLTKPMAPQIDYSLLLQVDRAPADFERSPGAVRVVIGPEYASILWQVEMVGWLLLLLMLPCVFFSIRWWHAFSALSGAQWGN